jgi:hypothetical protein
MGDEHRGRVEAERRGLSRGGLDELRGREEDSRKASTLEIGDVVHTARRARTSVGQGFDHDVALGGDLVAQVDRCRLGEGGLGKPEHPQAAAFEQR